MTLAGLVVCHRRVRQSSTIGSGWKCCYYGSTVPRALPCPALPCPTGSCPPARPACPPKLPPASLSMTCCPSCPAIKASNALSNYFRYCRLPNPPGNPSCPPPNPQSKPQPQPNSTLPCCASPTCNLVSANSLWHSDRTGATTNKMADDLIQSSMAGAQPVPANFDANDADNLEDVSPQPPPGVATWGRYADMPMACLTDPLPPD